MTQQKSLKAMNTPYIAGFAIVNIALFVGVAILGRGLHEVVESISLKDSIYGVIAPGLAVVLSGLVDAESKARIIFWKWSNPLPGSSAFTKYIFKDARFSAKSVKEKWGDLPTLPEGQNQLWYRIFGEVEDDIRVRDAHRNWLLTRDLTSISFVFLLLFSVLGVLSSLEIHWWYYCLMLAQYFTLMLAARRYAQRFVTTVIAVAVQN